MKRWMYLAGGAPLAVAVMLLPRLQNGGPLPQGLEWVDVLVEAALVYAVAVGIYWGASRAKRW